MDVLNIIRRAPRGILAHKRFLRCLFIRLVGLALLSVTGCSSDVQDYKESRFLLGTIVEFTISDADEDTALAAIAQAGLAMQKVEAAFTVYGEQRNTVKQFNASPEGVPIALSPDVSSLLEQAIAITKQTDGAFDPTLGDLNLQWGFSGEVYPDKPLSKSVVEESLKHSGIQHLQHLQNNMWQKNIAGLQLDFGGIAKGLAIDVGIKALRKAGIEHAIINAGGDMRVLGLHHQKPWRIAIRHPRKETPLGWIEVNQDMSIVTSGDYERFFMYQGKRYHHIIDPKTGFPSSASMSVTLVTHEATQADALSTAMFILGYKKGMRIIESLPNVEAVWVDGNLGVHVSSGMSNMFHKQ